MCGQTLFLIDGMGRRAPVATDKEQRPSEARERRGRETVSAPERRSRRIRSDKSGDGFEMVRTPAD